MMKSCVYLLGTIFGIIGFTGIFVQQAYADDLLKQAYSESADWEYSSDREGDEVLGRKSLNISLGGVELQGPVISRIAQFMIRMVVVLAIPMLLYSAIKIMLAAGDSGKLGEALKHIGYVVLGVFVALASVMLVLLIISVTNTNLGNI